jgi:hypothetical protein
MNRNRPTRTFAVSALELLDERVVPTTGLSITQLPVATQEAFVTNRAGEALGSIYTQYMNYEAAGLQGTFSSSLSNQIYTSGTSVGVNLSFSSAGNFNTLLGQLEGIGMQVTATESQYGFVEGYLPISQLSVVASNGYATSLSPVDKPDIKATTPTTTTSTVSNDETLVTNRAGQALGSLYTQYTNYVAGGSEGTFTSTLSSQIYMSGTSVGVNLSIGNGGDFSTVVSQLEGIGMQVTATSTQDGIVEGYLPISQLPVVASNGYLTEISPVSRPVNH